MTPSTVYLYRIQPDRNCYRYYELSLSNLVSFRNGV